MPRFLHSIYCKIIAITLIVSFIIYDLSWAYPNDHLSPPDIIRTNSTEGKDIGRVKFAVAANTLGQDVSTLRDIRTSPDHTVTILFGKDTAENGIYSIPCIVDGKRHYTAFVSKDGEVRDVINSSKYELMRVEADSGYFVNDKFFNGDDWKVIAWQPIELTAFKIAQEFSLDTYLPVISDANPIIRAYQEMFGSVIPASLIAHSEIFQQEARDYALLHPDAKFIIMPESFFQNPDIVRAHLGDQKSIQNAFTGSLPAAEYMSAALDVRVSMSGGAEGGADKAQATVLFSKYRIAIPQKFRARYYAPTIEEEPGKERTYYNIEVDTPHGKKQLQIDSSIPRSFANQWKKVYEAYAKTAAILMKQRALDERDVKIVLAKRSPYLIESPKPGLIVVNEFYMRFFNWVQSDGLKPFPGVKVKAADSDFWASGNEKYYEGDVTGETGKVIGRKSLRSAFHVLTMPVFYSLIDNGLKWQDLYELFDQIHYHCPRGSILMADGSWEKIPFSFGKCAPAYNHGYILRYLWEVWGPFLDDPAMVERFLNPLVASDQLSHGFLYRDRSKYFEKGYKETIQNVRRYRWTMRQMKARLDRLRKDGHELLSKNPELAKHYLGRGEQSWVYLLAARKENAKTISARWQKELVFLEKIWGSIIALYHITSSRLSINNQELNDKDHHKSWAPEEELLMPKEGTAHDGRDKDTIKHLTNIFRMLSVIRWGIDEGDPNQSLYGMPKRTLHDYPNHRLETTDDLIRLQSLKGLSWDTIKEALVSARKELGVSASDDEVAKKASETVLWREAPTIDNLRHFITYLYSRYDKENIRQALINSVRNQKDASQIDRSGVFKPFQMLWLADAHRIFHSGMWLVDDNLYREIQENGYPMPWMGMLFDTDGNVDPDDFDGMQIYNIRPVYFDTQLTQVLSEADPEFISVLIKFLEEKSSQLGRDQFDGSKSKQPRDNLKWSYFYREPLNYLLLINKYYPELFQILLNSKPGLAESDSARDMSAKREYGLFLHEDFNKEAHGLREENPALEMQGLNVFHFLSLGADGLICREPIGDGPEGATPAHNAVRRSTSGEMNKQNPASKSEVTPVESEGKYISRNLSNIGLHIITIGFLALFAVPLLPHIGYLVMFACQSTVMMGLFLAYYYLKNILHLQKDEVFKVIKSVARASLFLVVLWPFSELMHQLGHAGVGRIWNPNTFIELPTWQQDIVLVTVFTVCLNTIVMAANKFYSKITGKDISWYGKFRKISFWALTISALFITLFAFYLYDIGAFRADNIVTIIDNFHSHNKINSIIPAFFRTDISGFSMDRAMWGPFEWIFTTKSPIRDIVLLTPNLLQAFVSLVIFRFAYKRSLFLQACAFGLAAYPTFGGTQVDYQAPALAPSFCAIFLTWGLAWVMSSIAVKLYHFIKQSHAEAKKIFSEDGFDNCKIFLLPVAGAAFKMLRDSLINQSVPPGAKLIAFIPQLDLKFYPSYYLIASIAVVYLAYLIGGKSIARIITSRVRKDGSQNAVSPISVTGVAPADDNKSSSVSDEKDASSTRTPRESTSGMDEDAVIENLRVAFEKTTGPEEFEHIIQSIPRQALETEGVRGYIAYVIGGKRETDPDIAERADALLQRISLNQKRARQSVALQEKLASLSDDDFEAFKNRLYESQREEIAPLLSPWIHSIASANPIAAKRARVLISDCARRFPRLVTKRIVYESKQDNLSGPCEELLTKIAATYNSAVVVSLARIVIDARKEEYQRLFAEKVLKKASPMIRECALLRHLLANDPHKEEAVKLIRVLFEYMPRTIIDELILALGGSSTRSHARRLIKEFFPHNPEKITRSLVRSLENPRVSSRVEALLTELLDEKLLESRIVFPHLLGALRELIAASGASNLIVKIGETESDKVISYVGGMLADLQRSDHAEDILVRIARHSEKDSYEVIRYLRKLLKRDKREFFVHRAEHVLDRVNKLREKHGWAYGDARASTPRESSSGQASGIDTPFVSAVQPHLFPRLQALTDYIFRDTGEARMQALLIASLAAHSDSIKTAQDSLPNVWFNHDNRAPALLMLMGLEIAEWPEKKPDLAATMLRYINNSDWRDTDFGQTVAEWLRKEPMTDNEKRKSAFLVKGIIDQIDAGLNKKARREAIKSGVGYINAFTDAKSWLAYGDGEELADWLLNPAWSSCNAQNLESTIDMLIAACPREFAPVKKKTYYFIADFENKKVLFEGEHTYITIEVKGKEFIADPLPSSALRGTNRDIGYLFLPVSEIERRPRLFYMYSGGDWPRRYEFPRFNVRSDAESYYLKKSEKQSYEKGRLYRSLKNRFERLLPEKSATINHNISGLAAKRAPYSKPGLKHRAINIGRMSDDELEKKIELFSRSRFDIKSLTAEEIFLKIYLPVMYRQRSIAGAHRQGRAEDSDYWKTKNRARLLELYLEEWFYRYAWPKAFPFPNRASTPRQSASGQASGKNVASVPMKVIWSEGMPEGITEDFQNYRGEVYYPCAGLDRDSLRCLINMFPNAEKFVFNDAFDPSQIAYNVPAVTDTEKVMDTLASHYRYLADDIGTLKIEAIDSKHVLMTLRIEDPAAKSILKRSVVEVVYSLGNYYEEHDRYGMIYIKAPGYSGRLSRHGIFWRKINDNLEKGGYVLLSKNMTYEPHISNLERVAEVTPNKSFDRWDSYYTCDIYKKREELKTHRWGRFSSSGYEPAVLPEDLCGMFLANDGRTFYVAWDPGKERFVLKEPQGLPTDFELFTEKYTGVTKDLALADAKTGENIPGMIHFVRFTRSYEKIGTALNRDILPEMEFMTPYTASILTDIQKSLLRESRAEVIGKPRTVSINVDIFPLKDEGKDDELTDILLEIIAVKQRRLNAAFGKNTVRFEFVSPTGESAILRDRLEKRYQEISGLASGISRGGTLDREALQGFMVTNKEATAFENYRPLVLDLDGKMSLKGEGAPYMFASILDLAISLTLLVGQDIKTAYYDKVLEIYTKLIGKETKIEIRDLDILLGDDLAGAREIAKRLAIPPILRYNVNDIKDFYERMKYILIMA